MKTAPYGSWKSPITAELITKAAPSLDQPQGDGDTLYWLESRPWEGGRNVIMQRQANGDIGDVLPAPLGARSRVHEYGGSPYLVTDNVLYFCLDADQRVYRLPLDKPQALPEPLTPEKSLAGDTLRFADFCFDRKNQQLLCVCEQHSNGSHEPTNTLVAIPLDGSQQLLTIASGADFYSNPRLSSDGKQLSWLCWQHPQMPWDGTELWLADWANTTASDARCVAGGNSESISQPQWSPQNELFFISDRNNWWNLYKLNSDGSTEAICQKDAEFATPQWVFGMSSYGFIDSQNIACCYTENSHWKLATINLSEGSLQTVANNYSDISTIHCHSGKAFFIGGSSQSAPQLAQLSDGKVSVVYGDNALPFDKGYLSIPTAISYPTSENSTSHGIYYPPCNPDYQPADNELAPLIVMCHGGPTAAAGTGLNFKAQFWASRGFAVLDVNYRGSTGYGRQYRDALKGNWGLLDVDDVVYGANYLAAQNLVDRQRMAIRGGSAGGYTVLAALTFHNTFKAGASLYGVGDLEMLAADTHKFEARYMDSLVGPYPQSKSVYVERSPIHHIEQLNSPVIFLQGLDDKVVPPNQAETMVAALNKAQVPVAYVPFAGEGHGFRKAENIIRAYQAEFYFYSRTFNFELAEAIEPIHINNLSD